MPEGNGVPAAGVLDAPNRHSPGAVLGGVVMVFMAGMLALAVGIGVVESTMARLRMAQVPLLLVAACLLSAFGIVLVAR